MNKLLEIAENTAKLAGHRLQKISDRRINTDAGNDVKLQEDVESEMFIREQLSSTNIPVIGEEKGGDLDVINSGNPYWIVDPIDGTYNFLRSIPGVCVSIALMRGWTPILGAIYDFTRDELFSGGKDLPLKLNGREIIPAWSKDIKQAVLMTGFPSATDYSDANLAKFVMTAQKFKKVRMCGSAAIAMAWVAVGRADCYKESRIYLWDVAAGLALMESTNAPYSMKQLGIAGKPLCVEVQAASQKDFFIE